MKEVILFGDFLEYVRNEISALFRCPTEECVNDENIYVLRVKSAYGIIDLGMVDIVEQYIRFVKDDSEDSLATIIKVIAWMIHEFYMEE